MRQSLIEKNKNGTFKNVSEKYGLLRSFDVMGLGLGDIDNDGFLDIYLGTGMPSFSGLYPNVLLRKNNGEFFEDITIQTHTGHLQKGHQISIADINNDGFNDIYINIGGLFSSDFSFNAYFNNPGNSNNYIKLSTKIYAN